MAHCLVILYQRQSLGNPLSETKIKELRNLLAQASDILNDLSCPVEVKDGANELHEPLNFRFDGHAGEVINHQKSSVYRVQNLNASGPGSLAAAPADSYVIFPNLSGTINTATAMIYTNPDIWVLGQTSPSGIQIRGGSAADHQGLVDIRADGHAWQHVRIRPDLPNTANNCCHGPMIFYRVNSGVADHMSLYWGDDDCMDSFESDNVTVSHCIIAEGLVTPSKSARGSIASRGNGISYIGNLFAHHSLRGPLGQDLNVGDFVNNIQYNMIRSLEVQSINGSPANYNVECNIQIDGPDSAGSFWQDYGVQDSAGAISVYSFDNKALQSANQDCATAPEVFWFDSLSQGGALNAAASTAFTSTPFDCPRKNKIPVCDVLDAHLPTVGASHNRDALDARVVGDVLSGTGSLVSAPGPWPPMTGGNSKDPWDFNNPDQLSADIKAECGIDPTNTSTHLTNENGGNLNDFLYILDYCDMGPTKGLIGG